MNVGDQVMNWDGTMDRICEIYKKYKDVFGYECYDILYPERNVPLESIMNNEKIKKGDVVFYKKRSDIFKAYVLKVDRNSLSAQIRIIKQKLYLN